MQAYSSSPAPLILVSDPDTQHREQVRSLAAVLGYKSIGVAETAATREHLADADSAADLLLVNADLPRGSGLDLVRELRSCPRHQDLPIIVMTPQTERPARADAVASGADDFLCFPVDLTELSVRLRAHLRARATRLEQQRQQMRSEEILSARTHELAGALEGFAEAQRRAREAHLETIHRMALAAEIRDGHTALHIRRVSYYCAVLGRRHGLSPVEVETLQHASSLHDVGKLGTPDSILLKPGRLTDSERLIMQQHTVLGQQMLLSSQCELLQRGEEIALTHHERWDGGGYPNNLSGTEIPLSGRICAVADVFDALTSRRPYKPAFPNSDAYAILRQGAGSHFDPDIVQLFFDSLTEIENVQRQFREEELDSSPDPSSVLNQMHLMNL